jgi:hypothetical protein
MGKAWEGKKNMGENKENAAGPTEATFGSGPGAAASL